MYSQNTKNVLMSYNHVATNIQTTSQNSTTSSSHATNAMNAIAIEQRQPCPVNTVEILLEFFSDAQHFSVNNPYLPTKYGTGLFLQTDENRLLEVALYRKPDDTIPDGYRKTDKDVISYYEKYTLYIDNNNTVILHPKYRTVLQYHPDSNKAMIDRVIVAYMKCALKGTLDNINIEVKGQPECLKELPYHHDLMNSPSNRIQNVMPPRMPTGMPTAYENEDEEKYIDYQNNTTTKNTTNVTSFVPNLSNKHLVHSTTPLQIKSQRDKMSPRMPTVYENEDEEKYINCQNNTATKNTTNECSSTIQTAVIRHFLRTTVTMPNIEIWGNVCMKVITSNIKQSNDKICSSICSYIETALHDNAAYIRGNPVSGRITQQVNTTTPGYNLEIHYRTHHNLPNTLILKSVYITALL